MARRNGDGPNHRMTEKKDFAAPYEDFGRDTHWAECKNYDKRISINTLSPTLVMSAIEEVPNIIFFLSVR